MSDTYLRAVIRPTFAALFCLIFGASIAGIGSAAAMQGNAQGAILSGVGTGLVGVGFWLYIARRILEIDKAEGVVRVTQIGLGARQTAQYMLHDRLRLHVQRRREEGGRRYRLVILVPPEEGSDGDDEITPLSPRFSQGGWRKGRFKRRVNAWLGVPDDP